MPPSSGQLPKRRVEPKRRRQCRLPNSCKYQAPWRMRGKPTRALRGASCAVTAAASHGTWQESFAAVCQHPICNHQLRHRSALPAACVTCAQDQFHSQNLASTQRQCGTAALTLPDLSHVCLRAPRRDQAAPPTPRPRTPPPPSALYVFAQAWRTLSSIGTPSPTGGHL